MLKLALISLLFGACVADDPTTLERALDDDAISADTRTGTVDIGGAVGDDAISGDTHTGTVVITGIENGRDTSTHPKLPLEVTSFAMPMWSADMCAEAKGLPQTNVCSTLCDPGGFVARVFGGGGTGLTDCTEVRCTLSGQMVVNVDVCVD